ncbi:MAG TPA: alanine--tRNA ligase, partial [Alphaproteobacteria bacterium]|nr:alanine--tRNA ligase [Alphaproteobacteria bacterium]
KLAGGPPGSPDADGDRYVEIWNLVFMQYEQEAGGARKPLPKPSIDTGMGLERIAAVLQGKHDNFDIDLLRRLIEASAALTNTPPDGPHAVSHRVIADHLRAVSFLIADGVMPSNEGRGYVLRRILRRAMRHAHMLGVREPLLNRLVPTLVAEMGPAFPELVRAQALVTETLKLEESRFLRTLERGLKLLEEETAKLAKGAALPGEVAFKLYDTYGFPLDLTQDALKPQGRAVEVAGFDTAMARQREEARKAWAGSGDAATEKVWFEVREKTGATEFLGYEAEMAEGKVAAIVVAGKPVEEIEAGTEAIVVCNQTPFYGESGGQTGDTGELFTHGQAHEEGAEFAVVDTQKKLGDLFLHIGRLGTGTLKVGDIVEMRVDRARRARIRANHSATHLLHAALRHRLGEHVTQKGSLVAPDRLRFDISQPKPLTADDVRAVEEEVNAAVRANKAAVTRLMSPEDAVKEGAMALFGEKYGDEVRVVSLGGHEGGGETPDDEPLSVELCGGTHVRRTGDIGAFRIVSESALASGIRRIEAVTGAGADAYDAQRAALVTETASTLKIAPADLPTRVAQLAEERRKLEREVAELRKKLALSGGGAAVATEAPERIVAGVKLVARTLDGVAARDLKGMADEFKTKIGSGVVALVATADGKASLVVAVTPDLTSRISAVDLVKIGSEALGGKGGGGRPDMAQAGGPDGAKAADALAAIEKALAAKAA